MFTRNRVHTHESGTVRRNKPDRSQRPRCVFSSKEPCHRKNPMDGVSTYLALIFGTLLSSQGTDASFVLTLSGFPPGASLRVPKLYQGFSVSLTTVPQACGTDPEIGSDKLGAAGQGRLVAPLSLEQEYDCTRG